jgi:RNA polymerase-associated protein RTF1
MTTREEEERAEALKRASQLNASKSKKKSRKHASDSEEDIPYSEEEEIGIDEEEDMEDIDEYGPDLYKDEEDRKRLQALPEVERERILAERSEERQRNLERLEVRKLLKDGRREDITRRSARAKGSSTSQALSELARRREEKNKVRSKRGRSSEAPSSPDKRRRKRYESDYENSAEESPLSEDESEKKSKKRTPQLEEMQSACISRSMIEKWLFAPFFENLIIDGFVRIFIGHDAQKKTSVYRLCQVLEVVPWHKTYKIGENTWCNKAIKLKHGKAEKAFPMDIVSNQPVSQQEYSRFLSTLEYDRIRVPSIKQINQKVEDIKNAREYVLNDKEVNEMIEKKRSVKGSSTNAALEKAQLIARLEHAKSNNEVDQVLKLTKELKELEERTFNAEDQKQNVWAGINSRNRERDRIEAHEAELRANEARRKELLESAKAHRAAATTATGTTNGTTSTTNGITSDSAIMMAETTRKPLVKLAALNTSSFNLGKTLKYQTPYEKLVNKIALEIPIELLDEQ